MSELEDEDKISLTMEDDKGQSANMSLSSEEAYHLGIQLVSKSGLHKSQSDKPLLEQTPWITINEPNIDFLGSDTGGVILAMKPADLRPVLVTMSREMAVEVHRMLGEVIQIAEGRMPKTWQ